MEWSNKEEKSIKKLLATTTEAADLIEKMVEEMSTLMVYYRCAIMEVETKLKVLNEEFSLKHDRNPINHQKPTQIFFQHTGETSKGGHCGNA